MTFSFPVNPYPRTVEQAPAPEPTFAARGIMQGLPVPEPPPPPEPQTSLSSKQFITFVDLLSEGEIEGFPSASAYDLDSNEYYIAALKDIYLNSQPILRANADPANPQEADYNYKNVNFNFRPGTKNQTFIPNFIDAESSVDPANEVNVGVEATKANPVTISILRPEVDGVRLTIAFPSLQRFAGGGVVGTTVEFRIEYSYSYTDESGDTVTTDFITAFEDKITGRSSSKYQRSYRLNFDFVFTNVQVRLVKITEDPADPVYLSNSIYLSSYTELIYEKLTYPHSALAAIRLDSQQMPGLPTRSYRIRGIKVKIPAGVTVDQDNGRIIYPSGYIFDGTFAEAKAWTSDPAWVMYDILVNERYGLGLHIKEADLDAYAFYAASKYSSELVSNNAGGLEPRFSVNVLIQNQDDAYTLINELASVMRCMPYWSAGSLTISQDSPKDASYLFTNANVGEEGFQYRGTSIKQRHTVVVVSFFDMDAQQVRYEVVEDHEGITKFGIVQTEIKAFGCNSRSQAKRFGEWLLYTEANEGNVISFETGIDAGAILRPGMVIDVSDRTRSVLRMGGRTKAKYSTGLILTDYFDDSSIDVSTTQLSLILPDGTVETRGIDQISCNVSQQACAIHVDGNFSQIPNNNSVWMLQTTNLKPSKWRILSIEEKDESRYFITGIQYNSSKYDYIERGEPLVSYNTALAALALEPPNDITVEEYNVEIAGLPVNKLTVSWDPVLGVSKYFVRYRYEDGQYVDFSVTGPSADIVNTESGTYEIEVYSQNNIGALSLDSASKTFLATGQTALPETPTGLNLLPVSEEQAILSWDRALRADVLNGGKVLIRHNPRTLSGTTWKDSNIIVAAAAGNQTQKIVPLLDGTYSIKFETIGEQPRRSAAAAFVQSQVPNTTFLTQQTISEHSSFLGAKTNLIHDTNIGGYNGLVLDSASLFDDIVDLDLVVNLDTLGNVAPEGTYDFNTTVSLNDKYTVRISRILESIGYVSSDTIDAVANVDELVLFDGIAGENVNAKVYVKNSDNNTDWADQPWQELTHNFVTGQYFKFQARATSSNSDENIIITELGALLQLAARVETNDETSTTNVAADSVTFDSAFVQAPQIMITVKELPTGGYFELTNVTRTGFDIKIFNSTGTRIAKAFTYNAFGYGKAF